MQAYCDPSRWNIEDNLNISFDRRQPQFFINGIWPQFSQGNLENWFLVCNIVSNELDEIWKTTSILLKIGRQPQLIGYSKTISFFFNGRWPQLLLIEDDLNFFFNGRWPQFLRMEDNLYFFKMEDDLIVLKMVDNLNYF
jgi:hypothetical protein